MNKYLIIFNKIVLSVLSTVCLGLVTCYKWYLNYKTQRKQKILLKARKKKQLIQLAEILKQELDKYKGIRSDEELEKIKQVIDRCLDENNLKELTKFYCLLFPKEAKEIEKYFNKFE
ncbi:hypothetical protein [Iningainema tapete]|uniref:Transmembrane protein n=1 Tax=Iningainema tapete BLCC-T55 TaxID=2748662 RepID=A0A8J7BYV5_9CYAN|nr:hypothetical protein [Iningainema tapete]MBD2776402.1 hypothetical protein [Iningainema tapete BLCC-T55]